MNTNTEYVNIEKPLEALNTFVDGHKNRADAAEALNVSIVYLWRMLKRDRPIGASVLDKLGYECVVTKTYTYKEKQANDT